MTNKADIIKEYLDGASLGYLATFYGVSRQRIHQIVKAEQVHRYPVAHLNRVYAFEWFDGNTALILRYRGQRANWSEIHSALITLDGRPDRYLFDAWRKANKINPPSGLGPEVYCSKCVQLKPRSDFHKHKDGPGGLASVCKACTRKYQRANMAIFVANNKRYRARRKNHDLQS